MADGLNRVQLLGNIGADPELRFTTAGKAVLNFRLATSETWIDDSKTKRERTEWHSVVVWGNRAEALAKILHKGSQVFVEGSLRTSEYEDREQMKRRKTEIIVSEIILTGGRPATGEAPRPAPDARAAAARAAAPAGKPAPDRTYEAEPVAASDDDIPF